MKIKYKKLLRTFNKLCNTEAREQGIFYLSNYLKIDTKEISKYPDEQIIESTKILFLLSIKKREVKYGSYNLVYTRLINNSSDYKRIKTNMYDNKVYFHLSKSRQIKSVIIGKYFGGLLNNIVYYEHQKEMPLGKDYLFKVINNRICLIIQNKESVFHIETYKIKNGYNNYSVAIPLMLQNEHSKRILNGKDWIKFYIYRDYTEGHLYFIKMYNENTKEYFFKVGITKNTVKKRYSSLPRHLKIIEVKKIQMSMLEASIIERYLHKKYYPFRFYMSKGEFAGQNEAYYNDPYASFCDDILENAIEDLFDYNISPNIIRLIIKEKK